MANNIERQKNLSGNGYPAVIAFSVDLSVIAWLYVVFNGVNFLYIYIVGPYVVKLLYIVVPSIKSIINTRGQIRKCSL